LPKVVTQRHLEQDLNFRPVDRKPKRLTRCTTAPPNDQYTQINRECLDEEARFLAACHAQGHILIRVSQPTETATVLRPFFWDHPRVSRCQKRTSGLWCKGRLMEADTLTIRLGATPSGLTSAHLHHPRIFITGWMPFLPPNRQCQSTEGN